MYNNSVETEPFQHFCTQREQEHFNRLRQQLKTKDEEDQRTKQNSKTQRQSDMVCRICKKSNVRKLAKQDRAADEGFSYHYTCENVLCGHRWTQR